MGRWVDGYLLHRWDGLDNGLFVEWVGGDDEIVGDVAWSRWFVYEAPSLLVSGYSRFGSLRRG